MREIKFRAWRGEDYGMDYRVMAGWLGAFYVEGIDPKDAACMSPFNTILSERTPLMQFTGLKDKNGREIYEEDIVLRYEKHAPDEAPIPMKVYWNSAACGWSVTNEERNMHMSALCILELIGNIYENPELLTPEKVKFYSRGD